jgi:hypothetical protein
MAAAPESASRTASWYRHFGLVEAPGSSPCYAEWTLGIADDPQVISRIDLWPHDKRQPNLLLAAARFLGAEAGPYAQFRSFLEDHWTAVSRIVLSRSTQTNEAGRCATLLPSLAAISAAERKPLALIEVGASAGLRAGIDLNPLDVHNADDVAWLEALVWPGQDFRLMRLRQAVAVAQQDPPLLVAGDLNDKLVGFAAQAPARVRTAKASSGSDHGVFSRPPTSGCTARMTRGHSGREPGKQPASGRSW